MNSLVILSMLLASSCLALSASIGSSLRQSTGLTQFQGAPELATDAAEQIRNARQLSLTGTLSNALGGGLGLVQGVGNLLTGPLSSTLGALSGGLVTRVGTDSEWQPWWPQAQVFGRAEAQAQAQPWAAATAAAAAPVPLHYRQLQLQPDQPLIYLLN